MPSFSELSQERLETCHPDLQKIFNEVIKTDDCVICCGHRTEAWQHHAFEVGASKLDWPNSKHNSMPSMAVDVMPSPLNWKDEERIAVFAAKVQACANELGIKLEWGGSWEKFPDLDHYQLG